MHVPHLRLASRPWLLILFFLVTHAFGPFAQAQATETGLKTQLQDKPLFLRGLWKQDTLTFTHDGKPVTPYAPGPFTLAGIDVETVHFSADALEIKAHRVGLEFDPKGIPRRVRLKWHGYSGQITIRVAGHSGEDFSPALAAIFAPDLQTLIPSQEAYWAKVGESYLHNADLDQAVDEAAEEVANETAEAAVGPAPTNENAPSVPRVPPESKPTQALHVGGAVKPPVVRSSPDPKFSEEARRLKYSARVQVSLVVDASGMPTHVGVTRPAGLGLDERALAAVSGYRFTPATRDGHPVAVELWVQVNFQIL